MLELAIKAFYPSPPPFPLLHVDTRWKFQVISLFAATAPRKRAWGGLSISTPKRSKRI